MSTSSPRYYYRDPASGHRRYTCATFLFWVRGSTFDEWHAIFRRKTAILSIPHHDLMFETRQQLPPLPHP